MINYEQKISTTTEINRDTLKCFTYLTLYDPLYSDDRFGKNDEQAVISLNVRRYIEWKFDRINFGEFTRRVINQHGRDIARHHHAQLQHDQPTSFSN